MTPQRLVELALVAAMDSDMDHRHEGADAYTARMAWLRPGEQGAYATGYDMAAEVRLDPEASLSMLIEAAQGVITDLYTPALPG